MATFRLRRSSGGATLRGLFTLRGVDPTTNTGSHGADAVLEVVQHAFPSTDESVGTWTDEAMGTTNIYLSIEDGVK